MFKIAVIKPRRKMRKYPVKRDSYGRSARQRAFDAFDQGLRPARVASLVDISLPTACRYLADWKQLPQNLELRYRMMRAVRKSNREFSQEIIESLAGYLGMSEEEVVERLQKPWALKQLLMGKWPDHRWEREQTEAEHRLQAALRLIKLLESGGVPPKRILQQLLGMITQSHGTAPSPLTSVDSSDSG